MPTSPSHWPLARRIVDQSVLAASLVCLDSRIPYPLEQRVPASEAALRAIVIAPLDEAFLQKAHAVGRRDHMHLNETTALRHEREKCLLAASRHETAQVVGVARRQRDPRGHPSAAEKLRKRDLDDRSLGQVHPQAGSREPDAPQIVTPPNALSRIAAVVQIAQEETRPGIVARVTEHFGENALPDQAGRHVETAHGRDPRRSELPERTTDGDRLRPRRIVERRLLPTFRQPARIDPLDPAQLRIDPADLRSVALERKAAPAHGHLTVADRSAHVQKRLNLAQDAGRHALVLHLHGQRMLAGRQADTTRLVLGILRRIAVGALGIVRAVEPHDIPRSPAQLQIDRRVGIERESSPESDMPVRGGNGRIGPHQPVMNTGPNRPGSPQKQQKGPHPGPTDHVKKSHSSITLVVSQTISKRLQPARPPPRRTEADRRIGHAAAI